MADLFPAEIRATAVGLWQTSQQVGGVAANTVTSAVLANNGWRAVFKVSGSVVGAFAPVLLFALLSNKPAAAPAKAKAAAPAAKTASKPQNPLTLPGLAVPALPLAPSRLLRRRRSTRHGYSLQLRRS